MAFDNFRRSFEDLIHRAASPDERRSVLSRMRETLVSAKVAVEDMRAALAKSQATLGVEEQELATVRRRREMAEKIGDKETVEIATRYETVHAERVHVIQRKVEAQRAELDLVEREVEEMTAQLKAAAAGATSLHGAPTSASTDEPSSEDEALRGQMDSLARQRSRKEREADAERRLDELKRRMGQTGDTGGTGGAGT